MKSFVVLLYFALMAGGFLAASLTWQQQEKVRTQPIAYSHAIHVGKVGLQCTYCHTNVDKAIRASVPPLSTCMGCHVAVATDKPEIKKLTKYVNEKKPVPWVRIHQIPGHVYFSHKRHIKAGVGCFVCHGDVSKIKKMHKVRSLNMGFCVSCHKLNKAPRECITCHQ